MRVTGATHSATRCSFGLPAASIAGTLRDSCGARATRRYERKRNTLSRENAEIEGHEFNNMQRRGSLTPHVLTHALSRRLRGPVCPAVTRVCLSTSIWRKLFHNRQRTQTYAQTAPNKSYMTSHVIPKEQVARRVAPRPFFPLAASPVLNAHRGCGRRRDYTAGLSPKELSGRGRPSNVGKPVGKLLFRQARQRIA